MTRFHIKGCAPMMQIKLFHSQQYSILMLECTPCGHRMLGWTQKTGRRGDVETEGIFKVTLRKLHGIDCAVQENPNGTQIDAFCLIAN